MEEIQFFNYILAILSVFVSCLAMWVATSGEKDNDQMKKDIRNLYDKVSDLRDSKNNKR